MPEGPECTIVARQLNIHAQTKTISSIEILSGRYLKKLPEGFSSFCSILPVKVTEISNKGKFIYWKSEKGVIFSTLGMTGTYKTNENKYARVKFSFLDADSLYYSDMRNFGTLKFFNSPLAQTALSVKLREIGPDMLNDPCDEQTWFAICKIRENQSLVKFLMEQKNISGVGNIYKSESLFLAGLAPHRKVKDCSEQELLKLYNSVKTVLSNAFNLGGATIRNYSDLYNNHGNYVAFPSKADNMMKSRLGVMVYSKTHDPYGNQIQKITLDDSRTTYWSPTIQK